MKKYILIVIGLIIGGLAIGGGIAYLNNANDSDVKTQSKITKTSDTKNTEDFKKIALEHQTARAKTIEEYKEEFKKDKKYKENCIGEKPIDYSMFDKNDINAANQAVACYQLKYDQKRGTKEAENEYFEFIDFSNKFALVHFLDMDKEYQRISQKGAFQISSVKIIESLLDRSFYKYGLKAVYGELEFYPEISDLYVYENIAPYLSQEWITFLGSETNYEHHITTFHGNFRVTKCELEEMLEYYKDFNSKFPKFSKERGIPDRITYYQKALKTYPQIPD